MSAIILRRADSGFVLILAGLVLLTHRPAWASDRHTQTTGGVIGVRGFDEDFDEDSAANLASSVANAEFGTSSGRGEAMAGYKFVAAAAAAQKNHLSPGAADGFAAAESTDNLTLDIPSLPFGLVMTMTVELEVSGELAGGTSCPLGDAGFAAEGHFGLTHGLPNQYPTILVATGQIDNDGSTPDQNIDSRTVTVELPWENGHEYPVQLTALALVLAAGLQDCTAHASAQLIHTFKWMGVVSVTDPQGNAVADYTLVDEFGNDWTTPASDADVTSDGQVNVGDLLAVISAWGACAEPCTLCQADISPPEGDCAVNVNDLLMVITNWGG